jgi:DNA helicase-2/ATP-dependent DNA helicase PcrA
VGWLEATEDLLNSGHFGGKAGNSLNVLVQHFKTWRTLAQMDTPDKLAERMVEESGYAQMLRDDKEDDGKARLDNIKELLRAMQEYADLPTFLEHVALVSEGDTESTENVRLMTIHAAKGLEFPLVFLPGFEEGLFPHQRALNEDGTKGLEEERRLAYVAITRARDELIISYTSARRMFGQYNPSTPSRFLREIPADHLDMKPATGYGSGSFVQAATSQTGGNAWGGQGYRRMGSAQSSGNNFGGGSGWRAAPGSSMDHKGNRYGSDEVRPREPFIPVQNVPEGKAVLTFGDGRSVDLSTFKAEQSYKAGQRVHHEKFGPGRVSGLEGKGAEEKVIVDFIHAGTKRLLTRLAKLEIKD